MEAEVTKLEPNVKIEIKKLLNPEFYAAFDKLSKVQTFSGEMTFKIRRIGKKKEKELELYNELRLEKLKEVAKKDPETNEPVTGVDDRGRETYTIIPEKKKEFNDHVEKLQKVEVDFEKIKFSDLGASHGLSAHDLMQLDFIVE
jgi:hypothetical protein